MPCASWLAISEAEPVDHDDATREVWDHLAQQILAGDAEMYRALCELAGDLRRGQISHLHIGQAVDGAAVVARAARFGQREPGAGEERLGVFLQAALGGHRDDERGAHAAPLKAASRSTQTAKPTAGMADLAPSFVSNPS